MIKIPICLQLLALLCISPQAILAADDVCIFNVKIYDGTGSAPTFGHVAFKDKKITSVGEGEGPEAGWRIDGSGLVIAPGFIDLHTHSDSSVVSPQSRACVNYLMQGCTTSVTGNCGSGPVDVTEYYDKIDAAGAGTNVAHLIPQGSVRSRVVGNVDRPATAEELEKMCELARLGMDQGAWGMSTGLIYTPSSFASTDELIEIAKMVAEKNGIYASHIRGEDAQLLASVKEALEIGAKAGCPTHISHFKAAGTPNWGSLRVAIDLVEQAQKKGQTVTADQYPYIALSTSLTPILFPSWASSGGTKKLLARLEDPEVAPKIREVVTKNLSETDEGGQIVISSCSWRPEYVGKSVRQIAQAEGITPLQAAENIVRGGGAGIVSFTMNEEDVRLAMTYPWVATASDASARVPGPGRPHPRGFGTFPRKIGYYSIREGVLPLEQAIRSASGLPADIIGMKDRGYLKPGYAADLVIFDPNSFIDKATYEEPYHYAEGMKYVFVNGTPAVSEGIPTGALAGRSLRKKPAK